MPLGANRIGMDYLSMPREESSESDEGGPVSAARQKELRAPARQWLSSRFGSKEGADFQRIVEVCAAIEEYATTYVPPVPLADFVPGLCSRLHGFSKPANLEEVRRLLSGPGRKSGVINILGEIERPSRSGSGIWNPLRHRIGWRWRSSRRSMGIPTSRRSSGRRRKWRWCL